jgi:hypothetical protein
MSRLRYSLIDNDELMNFNVKLIDFLDFLLSEKMVSNYKFYYFIKFLNTIKILNDYFPDLNKNIYFLHYL